ncbi:hypothetical protein JJC00_07525 [Bradyrhizobium diazoefficiens]|uniref:hypothetical protein n=1 Tax=Bradyrhizobium diazoefficiens TaxID=1355477 RepID=UPI001909755C|nr:hypothetical protein [Bradyrhizobium diazoefficiens]QQO35488.1 hypothetical protein JJC00_07525 [Bradyrhizobium diazoefficiens]
MTAAKHDAAKPLEIEALLLIGRCEGVATKPRDFEAHGGLNSTSHHERDTVTGLFSQEANSDTRQRTPFAKLAWSLLSRLSDLCLSWEPVHPLHLIL